MTTIEVPGFQTYTKSIIRSGENTFGLVREINSGRKYLLIEGSTEDFESVSDIDENIHIAPTTPGNAKNLRKRLNWLTPKCLGKHCSAGFGDRLGVATPGHIQAVKNTGIKPIFAQQSVRENARTLRSPQQVLDDAMWGAFQEGWCEDWGADADHLKSQEQVDPFLQAGYTLFTLDPGDFADDNASTDTADILKEKFDTYISNSSEKNVYWNDYYDHYVYSKVAFGEQQLQYDELILMRCIVKYGKAIDHAANMYWYLKEHAQNTPFELEISVDETNSPTTPHEHYFIANELTKAGVEWVSLAPRFCGRFEKGVDYIGNLAEFEHLLKFHVEISKHFGSYKLSLHSGSDKFSLYPIVKDVAGKLFHLKTAGTSYLEALRVIATHNQSLFDSIFNFALSRYEIDKASYHVSANVRNIPVYSNDLVFSRQHLLDQFDARQVLHVTFGSVLAEYRESILRTLNENEKDYYHDLVLHFKKHLDPLVDNCYQEENKG